MERRLRRSLWLAGERDRGRRVPGRRPGGGHRLAGRRRDRDRAGERRRRRPRAIAGRQFRRRISSGPGPGGRGGRWGWRRCLRRSAETPDGAAGDDGAARLVPLAGAARGEADQDRVVSASPCEAWGRGEARRRGLGSARPLHHPSGGPPPHRLRRQGGKADQYCFRYRRLTLLPPPEVPTWERMLSALRQGDLDLGGGEAAGVGDDLQIDVVGDVEAGGDGGAAAGGVVGAEDPQPVEAGRRSAACRAG